MGIPLLRGRLPAEGEKWEETNTVIVKQSFARLLYGDEDPVGRIFRLGDAKDLKVIGGVSVTCGSAVWPNRPRRRRTTSTRSPLFRIRERSWFARGSLRKDL
ncbi:MAG: hypothetical protein J2P21_01725 [Chloracidobacterium sp.]|nr:hypothetical protein [Chloracidobacterium sp.]